MLWNAYSSRGLELLVGVSFGWHPPAVFASYGASAQSVVRHHALFYEELGVVDSRQSIEAGRIKE